ncbi:hypothetical protein [Frigidibacter oleivorans]|uniref:hypothetical protein n=1 Tax=Frigidibacter oleivorans TaxID=2487129 RepID=UPI000F8E2068|nr:hypothetical protein [Frigidibacter oleivorans]
MSPAGKTPVERAQEAWGAELPEWVLALARECARPGMSQSKVAGRLGRSGSLVSQVLARKYPGDLQAVQDLFEGVFRNATVTCPALGHIPTNECRDWRDKQRQFVNVNALRVRMYRACSACPRCRKPEEEPE